MARSLSIPDELASELIAEAEARKMTPDELAAALIAEQLPASETTKAKHRLSFAGVGASSSGRHARDDEQMLAEGFGR